MTEAAANKKTVFIAGHRGMVGSAIVRQLSGQADVTLLLAGRDELNLCDQAAVEAFFASHAIDEVYLAAARVGGIQANNQFPADFIHDNLAIALNVIGAAHRHDVPRLLFLGSSCIYPRLAEQPISEAQLLTGHLEPTNEPYAIAKIAGIKLCESYNRQHGRDYRSLMPTNLYGPGDNFHPENSHVIPALLQRFHLARQQSAQRVTIWGSGAQLREFLHVDDLAIAAVNVMNLPAATWRRQVTPQCSHLNAGTGTDISIRDLATLIAKVTGFSGEIVFDASKPDGAPRKLLDVSKLHSLGITQTRALEAGLEATYHWYCDHLGTDMRR
ncbi:GDP-L-fucose synthase [Andreprevotia sp. IGB-42]|uniref:GDP-L-fucose synthase family protein n=1 Tax=Andreprevotia sp. IGB-42 TaxID=2497473 RepID=UPI00135AA6EE|nr:GDP-L-fucose synthase [Andreprevotia sp. IGB-42]KAF0811501.1 GDP-L-fucose synthase [Andreprevotia sp. IGB-42]